MALLPWMRRRDPRKQMAAHHEREFLRAYAETGSVSVAAKAAGVTRWYPFRQRWGACPAAATAATHRRPAGAYRHWAQPRHHTPKFLIRSPSRCGAPYSPAGGEPEYPDGRIAVFLGPHRLADYDPRGRLIEPSRKAA